jgi:hypothetical protein
MTRKPPQRIATVLAVDPMIQIIRPGRMPGRLSLFPSPILSHSPVSCFPVSSLLKSSFVQIASNES